MDIDLSTGVISQLFNGEEVTVAEPIVQIISIKKVSTVTARTGADGKPSPDRYRLIVSDGAHFIQSMLATQLNHLVTDGAIDKNYVVRLKQQACNSVQNRKILILLDLEPICQAPDRIGEAVSVENASGAAPAAAPAAAAAPAPARGAASTSAAAAPPKPKPAANRGGGGRPGGPAAPIFPIEGLSPYQNKWTIKARVVQRSEIRHWSNQKGDGKLFSVNLLDETGEIRATGFNDVVDRLYNVLEEGKVFFISKARINIAKKQFSNVNNEYEIMFENHTEVEPCEDTDSVPQIQYHFTELAKLTELEKDATTDVIAIVKEVGEVGSINSKASGRPISKRDITLVDDSNFSCRLTIWGRNAETFEAADQPVIAFKSLKVGDFGGRSLSMVGSSTMNANPDIADAHRLRGWFDNQGSSASFTSHSTGGGGGGIGAWKPEEQRNAAQVKDEQIGMHEAPEYFWIRATVVFIKQDNLSYPACPTEKCNKKLILEGEDQWRCEKCDTTHAAPEYRYILSISVADATGSLWLNGFNDIGPVVIGRKADEMERLKNDDSAAYSGQFQKANHRTWNFSIQAKSETFNDVTRVRYNVRRIAPLDYVKAGQELISAIAKYGIA